VSVIPVDCFYNYDDKSLDFVFHDDLGCVMLSVQNLSTGQACIDYVDTIEGFSTLYISGDVGEYAIRIETQQGDIYLGEFTIE